MIRTSKKILTLAWVLLLFSTAVTLPYVHYHEVLNHNTPLLVKSDSSICFFSHNPSIELTPSFEQLDQLPILNQSIFSLQESVYLTSITGNLGDRAPPIVG